MLGTLSEPRRGQMSHICDISALRVKLPCLIHCSFFISSYGTPLAQRASYLALHSSLFGLDGTVNYDYIITNSINSLLTPNGAHTNHY